MIFHAFQLNIQEHYSRVYGNRPILIKDSNTSNSLIKNKLLNAQGRLEFTRRAQTNDRIDDDV